MSPHTLNISLDGGLLVSRQASNLIVDIAQTVSNVHADLLEELTVLGEDVFVVDLNGMAEKNRVRYLHHGRLQVQGEKDILCLRIRDLLLQKLAVRLDIDGRSIDNFTSEELKPLLQNGNLSIGSNVLDVDAAGLAHDVGLFRSVEISVGHVSDVSGRVRRPSSHTLRVSLGVSLNRSSNTAIGVTLTEDRVYGTSENLSVASLDFGLLSVHGVGRVVRDVVA